MELEFLKKLNLLYLGMFLKSPLTFNSIKKYEPCSLGRVFAYSVGVTTGF